MTEATPPPTPQTPQVQPPTPQGLRPYQAEAMAGLRQALRDDITARPLVLLPTGAGKGFILGEIASGVAKKGKRLLVLAHVKELVDQNARQAERGAPGQVGVYSAGLGRRDTEHPILCAGIQSVWKRADEIGHVDFTIVDECHLHQPDEAGMYGKFIEDLREINPMMRLIGLTATPYRLGSGKIHGPDRQFSMIAYRVSVLELIDQGYLSKLTAKGPKKELDFSKLHTRQGDFVESEAEELMLGVVQESVADMVAKAHDRSSVLVFCAGVEHAHQVAQEIRSLTGDEVRTIFGTTKAEDRQKAIELFKEGWLKWLVNVSVLTTGFDAPGVDCVVLMRPTQSPGLMYQMCGRGFRLAQGKEFCRVLDYGGNILRHGPIDKLDLIDTEKKKGKGKAPVKTCPGCFEYVPISCRECPACGYVFERDEAPKIDGKAQDKGVLSNDITDEIVDITKTTYAKHLRQGSFGEKPSEYTLKISYHYGICNRIQQFICFNHEGWAKRKAKEWWKLNGGNDPAPDSVDEAVDRSQKGELANPINMEIEHIPGMKYPELTWVQVERNDGVNMIDYTKF